MIIVIILTAHCYIHSRKKLPSSRIISAVGFNFTAVITFLGPWLASAVNVRERENDTREIGVDGMYSACEVSRAYYERNTSLPMEIPEKL